MTKGANFLGRNRANTLSTDGALRRLAADYRAGRLSRPAAITEARNLGAFEAEIREALVLS